MCGTVAGGRGRGQRGLGPGPAGPHRAAEDVPRRTAAPAPASCTAQVRPGRALRTCFTGVRPTQPRSPRREIAVIQTLSGSAGRRAADLGARQVRKTFHEGSLLLSPQLTLREGVGRGAGPRLGADAVLAAGPPACSLMTSRLPDARELPGGLKGLAVAEAQGGRGDRGAGAARTGPGLGSRARAAPSGQAPGRCGSRTHAGTQRVLQNCPGHAPSKVYAQERVGDTRDCVRARVCRHTGPGRPQGQLSLRRGRGRRPALHNGTAQKFQQSHWLSDSFHDTF